jgi:hypothetical protein
MIGGGAATTKLVEQLTRAIGAPVATPAVISVGNGEVDRARYRVFRWRCPACGGGRDDPIYRPIRTVGSGARPPGARSSNTPSRFAASSGAQRDCPAR